MHRMDWHIGVPLLLWSFLGVFPDSCTSQCNPVLCTLPECNCPGTQKPSQVAWEDTPQMLMLTFDDAVLKEHAPYYKKLFGKNRVNPSGCPIQATFFVCHNWTDYDMVGQLYKAGHEIASHTKTHRMPQSWWTYASYGDWENELEGERDNLEKLAGVARKDMLGARVPYLETGGDAQFQLMTDTGYLYDSSFMTGPFPEGGVWPFTLHYPPATTYCSNNNCPKKSYPNIWEIPLNRWVGPDGRACPMMDACDRQPRDKEDAKAFLRKNFDRHYRGNRAPLGMHLHATWFDNGNEFKLDALEEFLDEVLGNKDVYLITMQQVIRWMVQPQTLQEAPYFKHWRKACKEDVESKRKPQKAAKEQDKTQHIKLKNTLPLDTDQNEQARNSTNFEVTTVTSRATRLPGRPIMPSKRYTQRPRMPYFTRPKVNFTPIPSGLEAFPQPGRSLYNSAGQPYAAAKAPVTHGYSSMGRLNPGAEEWDATNNIESNNGAPLLKSHIEFEVDTKVVGSESLTDQEVNIFRTQQLNEGRDKKGFRVKIHGNEVEVIATDRDTEEVRKEGSENVAGQRESQASTETSSANSGHGVTRTVISFTALVPIIITLLA